ncbi:MULTISPECIES: GDYXXLXY domain-containing protein [Bacillaceae]|uniref:DUF2157 domain-containing protein n=1 Tax=Domibacillus aminovorans TaxID=29332 RepID=A0A177KIH1_9BACI|nr:MULTISPECIES: GDYXXLXY domain-containing protein [Bacillaceae]OAH53200.1 hypothetical protein AWH48_12655 [Domibacillus aminovorans]
MIAQKRGDIPYLLGLIFFITAIVYFFASNWPEFDRPMKIGLSLAVLLFCAGAALVYRRSKTFPYLGNWWLFLSVIAFAVAVALVGQMYNSHADSYVLFIVTLIPTIILALLTRYRPLYWLSFLLFELTLWMKLYPTGTFVTYTTGEQLLLYSGLIALHIGIYFFWLKMHEQKLSFLSLIVSQYCALYLLIPHSIYDLFTDDVEYTFIFMLLHVLYIAFIIFFWKSFMKVRKHHPFELAVHLLFFGLYVVWNVFYIWFSIMGEYIFYAGLPMLFILFAFSIFVLRKLKTSSETSDRKWSRYTISLLTGVLAFIGTIIAVSSLSSFIALIFGFSGDMSNSFLFLSVLCIGSGLAVRKDSWLVVRMTLQITGLVFAFLFVRFTSGTTWPAFLIVVPFIVLTILLFKKKEAILYYLAANSALLYGIFQLLMVNGVDFSVSTWVLFAAGVLNACLFFILKEQPVGLAAFWLSITFMLYSLTEEGWDSLLLHLVFLAYICWHLFRPILETRFYRWAAWAAFIGFIIWKYYEYAWLLLHKSLTFFLISVIFFAIWYVWGRKHTVAVEVQKWSIGAFVAVIAIQSGFLLFTAWQKEQLLQNGEIVALELAPIDPRSMLQGDYVQLNYEIQTNYREHYYEDTSTLPDGKVNVLLEKSAETIDYNGKIIPVYTASSFAHAGTGEGLKMKGKARAGTLTLGIEHFFIPENSGAEWEEKTHAIVRVAENGDAILETLE